MAARGAPVGDVVVAERMLARRAALTKGRMRRDRLDIDERQDCKALIFRAPPGFGKSVQVAFCADTALQRGELCIYQDLSSPRERGMSEAEVIAAAVNRALAPPALGRAAKGAGCESQALSALASNVNRVMVCLDGVCGEGPCGHFLEALVLETPATLRLVIAARETTNLTRLSLLTGVDTVGPAELAYDRAEAECIAGGNPALAEAMLSAAGGWPALCAFMQMAPSASILPECLVETHTFFENEILGCLETTLRQFLLNASMLETITPAAYDYVFKTHDATRTMMLLGDRLGLLMPDCGSRYELNPALRRYLRARFAAGKTDVRSSVLKRVAIWHWRRGESRDAISAALRAQDHRWVRSLSEDVVLDLALRQGEVEALCKWLADMPLALLLGTPAAALGYAWSLYFMQRAQAADNVLRALDGKEISLQAGVREVASQVKLVRAIGKATHDEMGLGERLCKDWLRDHAEGNPIGKPAALTCLAFIAASDRRFGALEALLQCAVTASRPVRQRYAFGWIAATRIQAELLRGDVLAARQVLIEAQQSNEVAADRTPFTRGMLEVFAFQIDSEDMSLRLDEKRLQTVLAFVTDFGVTDIVWPTVQCCADILVQTNNGERAFSLITECRLLAQERGLSRLVVLAELVAAGLTLASNMGDADEVLLREPPDLSLLPNQSRAIHAEVELLRAIRCLRDGRAGLADHHARNALGAFTAVADSRGRIRAHYVLAAALYLLNDDMPAHRHITSANLLAHQLGCVKTLRNTRALLLANCPGAASSLSQSIALSPASSTLAGPQPSAAFRADGMAVRLTSKQLGILNHAAQGMTNKEIAKRLYVTEDAVKWHFRRIFELLAVTSRTQAVAEAHERGLLR